MTVFFDVFLTVELDFLVLVDFEVEVDFGLLVSELLALARGIVKTSFEVYIAQVRQGLHEC